MHTVLFFGEMLLRLKPPGMERLFQSPLLEATFGGSEANAAISCAQFGRDSAFVTVLPEGALGDACLAELRRTGVDTSRVVRRDGRLGTYYFESGANYLPASVIYDRAHSALADAPKDVIDWDRALEGVSHLHLTGITPGVSRSAMEMTLDAAETARARGITVSCDYNYRDRLWKFGEQPEGVLRRLTDSVTLLLASEYDLARTFGFAPSVAATPEERCRELGARAMEACPNLQMIASTLRTVRSAEDNGWSACLLTREGFYTSLRYEIRSIVERVGAGDAFIAGLLYALDAYPGAHQKALEFAVAASCLKHSIPGDINRVSREDVIALAEGNGSARVRR